MFNVQTEVLEIGPTTAAAAATSTAATAVVMMMDGDDVAAVASASVRAVVTSVRLYECTCWFRMRFAPRFSLNLNVVSAADSSGIRYPEKNQSMSFVHEMRVQMSIVLLISQDVHVNDLRK